MAVCLISTACLPGRLAKRPMPFLRLRVATARFRFRILKPGHALWRAICQTFPACALGLKEWPARSGARVPPRCVRRLSSTMKTAGRRKPLAAGGGATFDPGPVGRTNRHRREVPPDSEAEVWHRSWAAACFLKLVNILADKPPGEISGRCHETGGDLVRIQAHPGFSPLLVKRRGP